MMKIDDILKNPNAEYENKKEVNLFLIRRLIYKSLIYEAIFLLLFVLGIIGQSRASKLSSIPVSYFRALIVFSIVFAMVGIVIFFIKFYQCRKSLEENQKLVKNNVKLYQVFDNLYFIDCMLVVLLFVVLFLFTPASVDGSSMEETYFDGDRILVTDLFYEPKLDDVVIIDVTEKYVSNPNTSFLIKRVVAVGGDTVTYTNNALYVNGVFVQEVSIQEYHILLTDRLSGETYYDDGVVPEGYLIVLGDNRPVSYDSRGIGLVNKEDILGKVIFRIYPFDRIGVPTRK